MIDYIAWADEYGKQAQSLLKVIEKKKRMIATASVDEKHMLNADIVRLRNIYYECMLTSKHLRERGERYGENLH